MSRLTNPHYLAIHTTLRQWWLEVRPIYGELSPREQWYLHDYFRPSHDDNELVLLAHRQRVSEQQPSLPQCAGRAWQHFQVAVQRVYIQAQRAEAQPVRQSPIHTATRPRPVRIKGVVRPDVDIERIAQAVFAQVLTDAGFDPLTASRSWDSPVGGARRRRPSRRSGRSSSADRSAPPPD